MVGIFALASSGIAGMQASLWCPESKYWQTVREGCEFWGFIIPQSRKTAYLQGFSQYVFILLTILLVLFSFSLLHIGNKPELSHTLICFSYYLCRNISDSLYWALHFSATSFQELAACRIALKIINFILQQSRILELSLTILVFLWYHNVILILFLSSSGVWLACRAALTALHFAAWRSSWSGCAQQNSPWNFWTNISHMVTFNLQET